MKEFDQWLEGPLGAGENISAFQMGMRAFIVFVVALVLIRVSGRRSFGMRSPFDNVIAILLGAVLGAAVCGRAPFIPALFAAVVTAFLHRAFALISYYSRAFGKMVKGEPLPVIRDGKLVEKNMKRCCVSERDLEEEARLNAHCSSLQEVSEACVERNGEVSVMVKRKEG